MSHQKISKTDVAVAIAALQQEGKRPSLLAIRAAIGGKGSMSTIQELKKQLDDEAAAEKRPPEALSAFEAIWEQAEKAGRAQRDPEIIDLQEVNRSLSEELSSFEGEIVASRSTIEEITKKYEDMVSRVNVANEGMAKAREDAERHSKKLLEVMEQHQEEITKVRDLLGAERSRAHDLELRLARAEMKAELSATIQSQSSRPVLNHSKA